jgi:hypothetical protein
MVWTLKRLRMMMTLVLRLLNKHNQIFKEHKHVNILVY